MGKTEWRRWGIGSKHGQSAARRLVFEWWIGDHSPRHVHVSDQTENFSDVSLAARPSSLCCSRPGTEALHEELELLADLRLGRFHGDEAVNQAQAVGFDYALEIDDLGINSRDL